MGWRQWIGGACIGAAVLAMSCGTALAGAWGQETEGWTYETDGELARGWVQVEKIWYYMDKETGLWQEKPSITKENAPYLLENILVKADLYQHEEEELRYRVEYDTRDIVKVSVEYEEKPDVFHIINTFDIDKNQKTAKSYVTKEEYAVY